MRSLVLLPSIDVQEPPATVIALLVLMALIAAATLVSEDLTCIAAGLLVAQGRIGFFPAVAACFAGILIGDLLLFWAGRKLGRPWLGRAPLRWLVSKRKVAASSEWFTRRGPAVIVLSRFMPGARLPTYFAAGVLHTPLRRFLFYFTLAVAAWTPLLVGLAAWLGEGIYAYFELFQRFALPGLLALAFGLWLLLFLVPRLFTYRGRRRLVGWWRRTTQWEFWPLWVFYSPVLLYVAWLMLRHRSPTLFTAANPGMPAGGFVGESKSAILDSLPGETVARYRRIDSRKTPEQKLAAVRAFVDEGGGELPVVLKPDVGERGRGVLIARTWEVVGSYLARPTPDLVVQEYVPGKEFGVFYYRLPGEENGQVFSITEKRFPTVTGDGRSTLEKLVLDDPRAVALSGVYLEALSRGRHRVPREGESVPLTDLGTHCRGAVFLDGGRHKTPELEAAIDRTSRAFDGFYFGRYDIRVPSEDDFRRGQMLQVIELNGVTSEATHIYDPSFTLARAYRTLFEQWKLAFEIGKQNRERGVEPERAGQLIRRALEHLPGFRDKAPAPQPPG